MESPALNPNDQKIWDCDFRFGVTQHLYLAGGSFTGKTEAQNASDAAAAASEPEQAPQVAQAAPP